MTINPTCWRAAAIAILLLPTHAATARADSLREALSRALATNPVLQSARALQRATKDEVTIQGAQGLPSIKATTNHREFIQQSSNAFAPPERKLEANGDILVPVYSGGAVKNAVRAANERVEAGQSDLRSAENLLLTQVVTAYMDVLLTEALVELAAGNVSVLRTDLEASSERYRIGDLTITDVAQSRSRLAAAKARVLQAEADLVASRAIYQRLVGSPAVKLEPPPPLSNLPDTADEALEAAIANNPDLAATSNRTAAAGYDTKVAGAGRLPVISLTGNAGYGDFFGTLQSQSGALLQREVTANVGAEVTIPVYQGGFPAARERQARAWESATLEQAIAAERLLIDQIRSTFARWQAASSAITSSQVAVAAGKVGLEGVRAGNLTGDRTILEVLNAEQELLDARTRLVGARRDAYVEAFTLLALMGRAGPRDLGLDEPALQYDP